MLLDSDERVRLAAVQAIANFGYDAIVQKLGRSGGVSTEKSLLSNLAGRIKDPKPNVRAAAIELLARIWGVAAGAIAEGSEQARTLLGAIPSHILGAVYINNPHINALVQRVLYESLLPVSYPPIRPNKASSQRVADSQNGAAEPTLDPDTIRVERILVLLRDLDERTKAVFFKIQRQQPILAKYMEVYLKTGELLHNEEAEVSRQSVLGMMTKKAEELRTQLVNVHRKREAALEGWKVNSNFDTLSLQETKERLEKEGGMAMAVELGRRIERSESAEAKRN